MGLFMSCVAPARPTIISRGIPLYMGVSTIPGTTELTRTPHAAPCRKAIWGKLHHRDASTMNELKSSTGAFRNIRTTAWINTCMCTIQRTACMHMHQCCLPEQPHHLFIGGWVTQTELNESNEADGGALGLSSKTTGDSTTSQNTKLIRMMAKAGVSDEEGRL